MKSAEHRAKPVLTDQNIKDALRSCKDKGIGAPYVLYGLPCGKKVWFDKRGRILSTTTAQCVRLANPGRRWARQATEMSAAEYERAKQKLLDIA